MNFSINKPIVLFLICFAAILVSSGFVSENSDWGFFGHRRINRLAVFTLPPEMTIFYREHLEYVTEHAVDPDKRRYAVKGEDIKHYIDIDHWGTFPFDNVPRDWTDALMQYTTIYGVNRDGDTLQLEKEIKTANNDAGLVYLRDHNSGEEWTINKKQYRDFFRNNIQPLYGEEEPWTLSSDSLNTVLKHKDDFTNVWAVDHFSEYGILPYNLLWMKNRLTKAFANKDVNNILRLSSDIGHYIGDAHVPLHTTENYNGQLTNQVGIHAFWESRLPELFADEEYDFFVGKATYIENPKAYFWEVVLASHSLLDSVLTIEKSLSLSYPSDQQFCFEERLGIVVRTQCKAYARTYHDQMSGMVETRMRDAIHSVGNIWYTCWVDAGQPNLRDLVVSPLSREEQKAQEALEAKYKAGVHIGRKHE